MARPTTMLPAQNNGGRQSSAYDTHPAARNRDINGRYFWVACAQAAVAAANAVPSVSSIEPGRCLPQLDYAQPYFLRILGIGS